MYLESASSSFPNSKSEVDQWHRAESSPRSSPLGLQGHAIKNQDLLIASGSLSLKGQEGLSAVDDDLQAAVCAPFDLLSPPSGERMLNNILDLILRFSLSYKCRIISRQT